MDTRKLKKDIINYLKQNGNYEKIDQYLIDELIYQVGIMELAKADIQARGIQVNVRQTGEPYFNLNQSVTIVQRCLKLIQSLMKELKLTPQERTTDEKETNSIEQLKQLLHED